MPGNVLVAACNSQRVHYATENYGVLNQNTGSLMSVVFVLRNLRTGLKKKPRKKNDAWEISKSFLKFKEKDRATIFSPSDVWCLPAPPLTKPKERENLR